MCQVSAQIPVYFSGNVPAYLDENEMGVFATLVSENLETHANSSIFFAGDSLLLGDSILSSVIFYNKVESQYISANANLSKARIAKLEIDNLNSVHLLDNVAIDSSLKFKEGHLYADLDTLYLNSESLVSGYSDASFIVCEAGSIHIPLTLSDSVFIPSGPSTDFYMPIILQNISNSDTVILSYDPAIASTSFETVVYSWVITKTSETTDTILTHLLNDSSAVTSVFSFGDSYVSEYDTPNNKWKQDSSSLKKAKGGQFAGAFSLVNSGIYNKASVAFVVPVELLYFSAESRSSQSAMVSWQTASEINNEYFILERSEDFDGQYTILDTIASKALGGNSREILDYAFLDKNIPSRSVVYYKLRQVDFNGDTQLYFARANIQIDKEFSIWPVPFTDKVTIETLDGFLSVSVYSTLGSLIYENRIRQNENFALETSSWSPGMYVVTIELSNGSFISKRIVK
jgi:hypothetical protein